MKRLILIMVLLVALVSWFVFTTFAKVNKSEKSVTIEVVTEKP